MKDAKGHGSNSRGSSLAPVPNTGGKDPAFDAFWAQSAGASVDAKARGQDPDKAAAQTLAQGGAPGKGGVPVHPAQASSPDTAKLSKQYDRNEDRNAHSENIALLAKNFGTADEHAKAKEIIAERNRVGGLPSSTKSVPNVHEFQYGIHKKYIGKLGS